MVHQSWGKPCRCPGLSKSVDHPWAFLRSVEPRPISSLKDGCWITIESGSRTVVHDREHGRCHQCIFVLWSRTAEFSLQNKSVVRLSLNSQENLCPRSKDAPRSERFGTNVGFLVSTPKCQWPTGGRKQGVDQSNAVLSPSLHLGRLKWIPPHPSIDRHVLTSEWPF
jgi:hypothetical protein